MRCSALIWQRPVEGPTAVAGGAVANTLPQVAATLLECVSEALNTHLRPVCRVYQTVGTPVIASCCECDEDEGSNGELSIHLLRMFDADSKSLEEVRRVRPCRGGTMAAQFRMVLARCLPTINEHGEIPEPEVSQERAISQMWDAEVMWQVLACCTEYQISIDDLSVDVSPMGGCSLLWADITVAVHVQSLPIVYQIEAGGYGVRGATVEEPDPGTYIVT